MGHKHFTAIVIGENHEEIMKKYSNNLQVEPFVILEFSKSKEYYNQQIELFEEMLKRTDLTETTIELIQEELNHFKEIDHIDYYMSFCEQMGYEIDKETGNAICKRNIDGHYDYCRVGKELSLPLITNDGEEVFSAIKKDIDFSKIHQYNTLPYIVAWETVVEGREPKNDEEKRIFDNMKNRRAYFDNFPDKETYVSWSTSFWGYAYVDQNEWRDVDTCKSDQIKWVNEFYDNFIKDLPKNERITVYECVRY
jgi:hypothetical protein